MSTIVLMGAEKSSGATPPMASATRLHGMATPYHGAMTVPARSTWGSARDLVGGQPPSVDDVPTTLAGEPLDSADKVHDFLEQLAASRSS